MTDAMAAASPFVIPELTRGLRTLGAPHGTLQAAHDAWFAPLIAARRAAAHETDPMRQLRVIHAPRLMADLHSVIAELAVIRAPKEPALRRAIEAALEDAAAPAFRALDRVAVAAEALADVAPDAGETTRVVMWTRWVDALRQLFVALEEGWTRAAPVLAGVATRD